MPIGGSHVYRFVVPDAGTYWYHSHQVSHEQVRGGLFGTFVVAPPRGHRHRPGRTRRRRARRRPHLRRPAHRQRVDRRLAGRACPGGSVARVRVVNTDSAAAARLGQRGSVPRRRDRRARHRRRGGRRGQGAARPGRGPGRHRGRRAARPARQVDVGGDAGPLRRAGRRQGDGRAGAAGRRRPAVLRAADRRRCPSTRSGRTAGSTTTSAAASASSTAGPGFWWTINGHQFPDVPMYVVDEGDVVVMTDQQRQRRAAPDAPARPPRGRAQPQRRGVDRRQWWIDSLAGR